MNAKVSIGVLAAIATGLLLAWWGVISWTPIGWGVVSLSVVVLGLSWWRSTFGWPDVVMAGTVVLVLVNQYLSYLNR
jgi:hypothetical protein